ncbi:MAG: MarR family transcriptional regulator [Verrucomicrobia bacterium]|nr:MarR family transcriptional regulator [Verrucomicrobiota bacterium]
MPGHVPIVQPLPRYEVLREAAERYPDLDPSSCYAFLHLLRTGDELLTLDAEFLNRLGTRQGRFNLMMIVAHCAHTLPAAADLAECTGVSRATVTGLLDGLERDGLIERQSDPEDRRMVRIKLTARGQDLLDRVRPAYFRWLARILEPLDESECGQLAYLLQKIRAQMAILSAELQEQAAAPVQL